MKYTFLILIVIGVLSCKKKPLEPVFVQNNSSPSVGMVYPKSIEIEDSINKSKATIYVTYTADSLVSSIKREINTSNANLDSTLEQFFTYEGKNVKTITTRWEYQPAGKKSNIYTEETYNYVQNRILNYQLITHNYGGIKPDTRDTVKYDYYVLKKSDGLDYYSKIIGNNEDSILTYGVSLNSLKENIPYIFPEIEWYNSSKDRTLYPYNYSISNIIKNESNTSGFWVYEGGGAENVNYLELNYNLTSVKMYVSLYKATSFIYGEKYFNSIVSNLFFLDDYNLCLPIFIRFYPKYKSNSYFYFQIDTKYKMDSQKRIERINQFASKFYISNPNSNVTDAHFQINKLYTFYY